uniref:Uncharacterized protein n=1 Tax=Anguilla anguilla TaxID=7936 RepID=A0A0E9QHJ2_ANGAN
MQRAISVWNSLLGQKLGIFKIRLDSVRYYLVCK